MCFIYLNVEITGIFCKGPTFLNVHIYLCYSGHHFYIYLCIDMLTNLKYIISIAIILISIPISDNITKKITNILQEKI